MRQVRTDVSPTALVAAIEANTHDAFARWGHALGADFHKDADVMYFTSAVPLQLANGVIRAHLTSASADSRIAAIVRDLRANDEPFAWLIGPSSQPDDLTTLLEARGLTLDDESPGMAVDLRTAPLAAPMPAGATVAEVLDDAMLSRWIDILCIASPLPDAVHELLHALHTRHGFSPNPQLRFYLGTLDGAPVATSLLFVGAGVAGIYCVATLPQARGRGFGTAMTVAPLRAARDAGLAIGVLQSSQMGYAIYRRLGFVECCTFRFYFGSPATTR
ncbi:MAG TPA: GNAT family N-acetyltransferase [Ktedonobacterales bacterium]|nr:GNAT family N-acetyltransferase [Ktedonobacterales bacterium]